jgi:SNF2 family DNA or RNA helicase
MSIFTTGAGKQRAATFAEKMETNFTLRPFQNDLLRKHRKVSMSLIGDDMGLGKTVEAIALDRIKRIDDRAFGAKTLVVAPLSVVGVWVDHYAWMLPNMKVSWYDPEGKQPVTARAEFLQSIRQGDSDVYVVHWDALRLMPELAQQTWFHVIADEAHRAKSRKSQQTLALKRIKPKYRSALTGTPAETRPDDLWSILNWLYPKKYSSYWRFYKMYVQWEDANGYKKVTGVRNVDHLQRDIKSFYTRRLKSDVAKDLPDKVYSQRYVSITPVQRKHYGQMKQDMLAWVGEHEDQPLAAPVVISRLMRLQQFAISSCKIVDGFKWVLVKDEREAESTNRTMAMFGPKIHTVRRVKKGVLEVTSVIVGDRIKTPCKIVKMIEPSSKLDTVMQLIEDNPNESIVVFSQFKQVIGLFAERLERAGVTHGIYTGDTDKSDRDRIVREFQAGTRRVFAGTIRAGGEGITLTKATTIVFIDRDWSPSKNRQAEDRLHRIGQKDTVQVIDIVAKDTVDRGRLQQIEQSWRWLKKLLGDK